MSQESVTSARVDCILQTNATWTDAFQFGTLGDYSWSFTGQNFRLDLKSNKYTQTASLLSLTSGAGQIQVQSTTLRILNMNVPEATFASAGIIPGTYDYDLIMYDSSAPNVRIPLMHGKVHMKQGVSGG
jgi:hypothetical protein